MVNIDASAFSALFQDSSYVGDSVFSRLRTHLPTEAEAAYLDCRPLIDQMRSASAPADREWLLQTARTAPDGVAGLAISLLRHHRDAELMAEFQGMWDRASPFVRNRLMWRLADDPHLGEDWRRELFRFATSDAGWPVFRDFNLGFYGPPEARLASLIDRVGDEDFPVRKKWLYALSIPEGLPDGRSARSLLRLARLAGDDFAVEVVDYIQEKWPARNDGKPAWNVPEASVMADGLDYVADALVCSMRSRVRPDERTADLLNRLPIVDRLRSRIEIGDVEDWVRPVLNEETGEVAGLYLSLLKRHDTVPDVAKDLKRRWEVAKSPFMRAHLMWRILDDPDLEEDWHRRIFAFVMEEWQTFHEVSLKFLGTPESVIFKVLRRMADPDYPDTKRWSYLCRMVDVGADQEAVRSLLVLTGRNPGTAFASRFAAEVASHLVDRFCPEPIRVSVR